MILKSGVATRQKCVWGTRLRSGGAGWEHDSCVVPGADFGCSGLPCTHMSRAGKRLKREGPRPAVYLTHGKYVETKKVPISIVECTPETRNDMANLLQLIYCLYVCSQ